MLGGVEITARAREHALEMLARAAQSDTAAALSPAAAAAGGSRGRKGEGN
jgi:hypothetical protein